MIDLDERWRLMSPTCDRCRHLIRNGQHTCSAFPGSIPLAIWNGEDTHRSPYPGDRGIQFAAMTDAEWTCFMEEVDRRGAAFDEKVRLMKAGLLAPVKPALPRSAAD